MLGDVDLYGLYLMGLGSCHIAAQVTLVFAEYILSYVHIREGYGAVNHVIVCYIVIVVVGGGSPNNPLYLTQ